MDCTSFTSSAWLLVYLAITAMLPVVWSAPTSPNHPFPSQTKKGLENVANVLIAEAGKLYTEICKTPNLCGSSEEQGLRMDLKLPAINDSVPECLSRNFNKEKCLSKIYNDLLTFQTYLDFLKESMPSSKNIIEFMQVKTKSLAVAIKHMEQIPSEDKKDNTSAITEADLRSADPWQQNRNIYIILQSFKDYMVKTARAVRNSVTVSN